MRKLIVSVVCACAATLLLAQAVSAQDEDGERVCRSFVVHGVVQEVGDRSLAVSVDRARPESLAGEDVELKIGSRTRMTGDGQAAVGSTVKAGGTLCQADEADEPVFYTKRVNVKRAERLRGAFELLGTVVEMSDEGITVAVAESSFESLVGEIVLIGFRNRTTIDGELVPGATVAVEGRARFARGESVLQANGVTVVDDGVPDPPPDEGE